MATWLQAQSYEVVVLSQGGFEERTLDLAKKLLGAVLKCGWTNSSNLPPLLSSKLCQAFRTFMFSGKAEMGRDFYVKIVNADKQVGQSREMLVMARCKGVATLQQLAMGSLATCIGREVGWLASKEKLNDLEIPLHLKEELEAFF